MEFASTTTSSAKYLHLNRKSRYGNLHADVWMDESSAYNPKKIHALATPCPRAESDVDVDDVFEEHVMNVLRTMAQPPPISF